MIVTLKFIFNLPGYFLQTSLNNIKSMTTIKNKQFNSVLLKLFVKILILVYCGLADGTWGSGSENGVAGVERGRSLIWGGRGVLVMKGGLIGGEVRGRAAMRERMYFYMCKFFIFFKVFIA